MGTLVLDSTVIIGFTRPDDANHVVARSEIRAAADRGDMLVLPATVLSESLVAAHRVGPAMAAEMRQVLTAFFGPERVVDGDVADRAAALRAAHRSLRLPDALVVATAIVDDAVALTCDKRLGSIDPRVHVL